MATATATKPSPPKTGAIEVTFPVRLLNAIGASYKEDTRYAMSSLLLESKRGGRKAETDKVFVVGTNGTCMVLGTHDTDLYGGEIDELRVTIPGDVARNALKVAAKSEDEEPVATLRQSKNAFTLTVKTTSGESRFGWSTSGDSLPFPPYQDVIPDFTLYGVSEIGVNPERTEKVLNVIRKIVGGEHAATMYLPNKANDPLGLKATDGDTIEVTAVVMPVSMSEWTKDPTAKENTDPDQSEMFDAWRGCELSELKVTEGLQKKLQDGGIASVGQLADLMTKSSLTTIEGIGQAAADKISDALQLFYQSWKVTPPAKPPTAEEKAVDDAQEGLLAYLTERFVHVGVHRETHEKEVGQKMDDSVLALCMTKAQAKDVGKAFQGAGVDELTGWLNKLKGFNDEKYREAATSSGFKFPKKTTLPS